MTTYQILALFSVPGLIAATVLYIKNQVGGIRKGVQALLRAQLLDDWRYYSDKGYAPIYARESFENCYQQYHRLGANGVMDDIHAKFLALPERAEKGAGA